MKIPHQVRRIVSSETLEMYRLVARLASLSCDSDLDSISSGSRMIYD